MTARREALFLAHRIPYPPDKGDKIRSWRILERLLSRFDVHLAAFVDDAADLRHRPFLEARCASVVLAPLSPRRARLRSLVGLATGEPLTFPYYRDAAIARAVAAARTRPLAVEAAFSSSMAPYLARRAAAPRVVDLCDADSEKWRQYAEETAGPMRFVYAREGRRLAAAETAIVGWADAAFAASAEEAAVFNARGPARPVDWFGNGVDAVFFAPDPERPRPDDAGDVVFVGAMDYRANVDAVLWFAREVWPRVRAQAPAARFSIVGANPAPAVRALHGRDDALVAGRVPDVRPYLEHAAVVVAPLQIARGVQNKVLEAMAAARPVVATSGAAEGIDAVAGEHFLGADAPQGFAEAILGLLKDPDAAARLGRAARARMLERCSWDAQMRRFDDALARLGVLAPEKVPSD